MVAPSRLLAACLAAAALLAAGCRRAPARITLGEVPLPGFGLLIIAHARGYLSEEGVEVTVREYGSGRDALAGLLAGDVDAATVYVTPIAARVAEVPDLRVLTTLHWSVSDTRVLARADRGILRPADLRGRRVGVPFSTSAELFLDTLLASAGVRPDEIERIDVDPAMAGPVLEDGEVDAVAVWFPHAIDVRLPEGALTEIRSTAYTDMSVLATRAAVLDEKRDALLRLLRALASAEQLARERPAVALDALERGLHTWPVELVEDGWSRVNPQLGLSNLLFDSLERQTEWQRQRHGGAITPDLRAVLDARLLLQVDRESVTLLGSE